MSTDEEIRAWANRDWAAVAALKDKYWAECDPPLLDRFRIADDLRRVAIALNPGWPTESDREEDLATHVCVGEMLRNVAPASRR